MILGDLWHMAWPWLSVRRWTPVVIRFILSRLVPITWEGKHIFDGAIFNLCVLIERNGSAGSEQSGAEKNE